MTDARESFWSKLGLAVIGPVLVILLAGGSSPWWLPVIFPSASPGASVPGESTGPPTPSPTAGESGTVETSGPIGDCVITIAHELVDLHEEPGPFTQVSIRVPPGEYAVSNTADVTFAGSQQRWLEITAEGRTGWIEDNTFNVDAKTAGCE